MATTEEQLEILRKRWKTADSKTRKIIEIRAKLLKLSGTPNPDEIIEEIIKDIFYE